MDIFERASRMKLRFPTARGPASVEDLWDLPLIAGTRATRDVKVDLDTIAKDVNRELKNESEESFVQPNNANTKTTRLRLALDILKHIIADKQATADAAKQRAARSAEKDLLLTALANKQKEGVNNLTEEELRARINALDAE